MAQQITINVLNLWVETPEDFPEDLVSKLTEEYGVFPLKIEDGCNVELTEQTISLDAHDFALLILQLSNEWQELTGSFLYVNDEYGGIVYLHSQDLATQYEFNLTDTSLEGSKPRCGNIYPDDPMMYPSKKVEVKVVDETHLSIKGASSTLLRVIKEDVAKSKKKLSLKKVPKKDEYILTTSGGGIGKYRFSKYIHS